MRHFSAVCVLCVGILFASAAQAAVIGKATVTADQAPVMSGKQVVVTAKKGDAFDVTEVKGDWFGLAPSQGWIHKSQVRYDAQLPASPAAPPVPAPAEWQKELTLDLGGGVTLKLALIPAGKFMMGEGEGRHEVTISKPFYMGLTEVTQAQYEAVMGTNPSEFKGATNPVERITWNDATEFCNKTSEKTRQTVRLPTEAEWEYACRAGSKTGFCFGDAVAALGAYAWYSANSGRTTHPVGQKKPNAWGLYDMHGNVGEWCADWYGDYPKGAATDPQGPASGTSRVLRGGFWTSAPGLCRSAQRGSGAAPLPSSNPLSFRYSIFSFGFRVAVSVSAPGP